MKIAYLISAYVDPDNLGRVINALSSENSYFFVHVDKKVDITPFMAAVKSENAVFLKNRFYVRWGAYSQVEAIEAMLREAYEFGGFERFVSMTGTDYPLYSNTEIDRFFSDNPDKQFVCGENRTVLFPEIEGRRYSGDVPFYRPLWLGRCIRHFKHIIFKGFLFHRKPYIEYGSKKLDVWSGSDYWAITRSAAEYILANTAQNKAIKGWLKKSFIPSERYVQTILFNSPFRNFCDEMVGDYGFMDISPLHYVVYENEIRICTEEDYNLILEQNKMLVRKIKTGTSDGLVRLIDERRARV